MSKFIKDTIEIDKKIKVEINAVKHDPLQAVILPFYFDPDSGNDLTVVLKRSIMPGSYARTDRKMGLSALTVDLPEDSKIGFEEVFNSLGLESQIQNAIPLGSVMPLPYTSTLCYELVLVHIEPVIHLDKQRGIVLQKKGEYEIGTMKFSDLVHAIRDRFVQDLKTKLILNELYILSVEESVKQMQNNQQGNHMIGNKDMIGGGNLPAGFDNQTDTMPTSTIPDEVIAANSKKDYGAMYSIAKPTDNFSTVEK